MLGPRGQAGAALGSSRGGRGRSRASRRSGSPPARTRRFWRGPTGIEVPAAGPASSPWTTLLVDWRRFGQIRLGGGPWRPAIGAEGWRPPAVGCRRRPSRLERAACGSPPLSGPDWLSGSARPSPGVGGAASAPSPPRPVPRSRKRGRGVRDAGGRRLRGVPEGLAPLPVGPSASPGPLPLEGAGPGAEAGRGRPPGGEGGASWRRPPRRPRGRFARSLPSLLRKAPGVPAGVAAKAGARRPGRRPTASAPGRKGSLAQRGSGPAAAPEWGAISKGGGSPESPPRGCCSRCVHRAVEKRSRSGLLPSPRPGRSALPCPSCPTRHPGEGGRLGAGLMHPCRAREPRKGGGAAAAEHPTASLPKGPD